MRDEDSTIRLVHVETLSFFRHNRWRRDRLHGYDVVYKIIYIAREYESVYKVGRFCFSYSPTPFCQQVESSPPFLISYQNTWNALFGYLKVTSWRVRYPRERISQNLKLTWRGLKVNRPTGFAPGMGTTAVAPAQVKEVQENIRPPKSGFRWGRLEKLMKIL